MKFVVIHMISQGSIFSVVWLFQTTTISYFKVALRTSEVLLNQKLFSILVI